jgi:hypothetical protein
MDVLGGCKYCIISAKANLYKAALSLHVIWWVELPKSQLARIQPAYKLRLQVLIAVSMKMAVLWVVASCRLVEVYQRFRDLYCLHRHGVTHRPDDGGSTDLWNVGKLISVYMMLQARRQPSSAYKLSNNENHSEWQPWHIY